MFPRSPEEEEEEFQERDEMLQLAVVSSQPLSTLTTTESYSPSKESLLKKINRGKSLHATQYCDQSYLPSIVPKIPEREETDKSATTTHKQTLFNKICSPPRSRTLSPGKKTESKLQTHDRLESAPAMKSLSLSLPPIHSHIQKSLTLQNPWNFDANAVYDAIGSEPMVVSPPTISRKHKRGSTTRMSRASFLRTTHPDLPVSPTDKNMEPYAKNGLLRRSFSSNKTN